MSIKTKQAKHRTAKAAVPGVMELLLFCYWEKFTKPY
jgi:hypothetical protein